MFKADATTALSRQMRDLNLLHKELKSAADMQSRFAVATLNSYNLTEIERSLNW